MPWGRRALWQLSLGLQSCMLLPLWGLSTVRLYQTCPQNTQGPSTLPIVSDSTTCRTPREWEYLSTCYWNLDFCLLFSVLRAGHGPTGLGHGYLEEVLPPPLSNVLWPVDVVFGISYSWSQWPQRRPTKETLLVIHRNVDYWIITFSFFFFA